MEGLAGLIQNFESNFNALDDARKCELLWYTQIIKISKFEEFKHRDDKTFTMVKNLFIFPGKFNREQLSLFATSFMQNTQSYMQLLSQPEANSQTRDIENKVFASLLWSLTFGAIAEGVEVEKIESFWQQLIQTWHHMKSLSVDELKLPAEKLKIYERALRMQKDECAPIMQG